MDPNAALKRIREAAAARPDLLVGASDQTRQEVIAELRREFAEACEDLAEWLRKGGFRPKMPADMRWIPGPGTRWAILSPAGTDDRWLLVRYDGLGKRAEQWQLFDQEGKR